MGLDVSKGEAGKAAGGRAADADVRDVVGEVADKRRVGVGARAAVLALQPAERVRSVGLKPQIGHNIGFQAPIDISIQYAWASGIAWNTACATPNSG